MRWDTGTMEWWSPRVGEYCPEGTPSKESWVSGEICSFPAITFFVGVVALSFYGIDKRLSLQIQDELAERRKAFAAEPT